MDILTQLIANEVGITPTQVNHTLELLNAGSTVPFISRYRKEATGGLDEVKIEAIQSHYQRLTELVKRREFILQTIDEQGKLTPELKKRISETWDAAVLEDLYLPYKPKRKTRAEMARQRGLEPLATLLLTQREPNPLKAAARYVRGEVKDAEEALKGARDIIAEQVSENEQTRQQVRNAFARQAVLSAKVVKGKEAEAANYRDYFDCSEPLKRCSSHRLLAMRRGESEGLLRVSIAPEESRCIEQLERHYVRGRGESSHQVQEAVEDAYKRLLKPSMENEFATDNVFIADAGMEIELKESEF